MKDNELKQYIRKTIEVELKKYVPDFILQKEILKEQCSFNSLSEFLIKLGIIGERNSRGLEATEFAFKQYIENGIQPGNELYDLLKRSGYYERLLTWSKDIALKAQTPLYQIVFAMYGDKHLTNTQFVVVAGNYYKAKMAEKNK